MDMCNSIFCLDYFRPSTACNHGDGMLLTACGVLLSKSILFITVQTWNLKIVRKNNNNETEVYN